jgi:hypothetical protein
MVNLLNLLPKRRVRKVHTTDQKQTVSRKLKEFFQALEPKRIVNFRHCEGFRTEIVYRSICSETGHQGELICDRGSNPGRREKALWMSLYFSAAVWVSLGIIFV